jgi:hypothetical protein
LAQDLASPSPSGLWEFAAVVLLILFVTLVARENSKNKDE